MTFHIRGQGTVRRERRVRVRRNLPSLSCRPRAQVQTVHDFLTKKFVLSMIICIFAALVPAEPLYNA